MRADAASISRPPNTLEQLQAYTSNLTRMALGNTAIATHKALEVLYEPVDPTDTSPTGSARVILYQIRCAFAHDPLNPIWTPKVKQYDRTYKVTVNVNRPSGELTISREIGFHPPSLKNTHLAAHDFGGLAGYLGLLHYFLAAAKIYPKGHCALLRGRPARNDTSGRWTPCGDRFPGSGSHSTP